MSGASLAKVEAPLLDDGTLSRIEAANRRALELMLDPSGMDENDWAVARAAAVTHPKVILSLCRRLREAESASRGDVYNVRALAEAYEAGGHAVRQHLLAEIALLKQALSISAKREDFLVGFLVRAGAEGMPRKVRGMPKRVRDMTVEDWKAYAGQASGVESPPAETGA